MSETLDLFAPKPLKLELQPPPGPRQTVDQCKHPDLGEGLVVYDNGPAWFQSASGEREEYKSCGGGGAGQSGSWLRAVTKLGKSIRLDTTNRLSGDSHRRASFDFFGPGWLVICISEWNRAGWKHRFEADSGMKHELQVVVLAVADQKGALPGRMSMELVDGSKLFYTMEPKPEEPSAP